MRHKQQTQIKLQRLFQQQTHHANDRQQTTLHYQAARVIAEYTDYRKYDIVYTIDRERKE